MNNSAYEEYMRSVLGYNPMQCRNTYENDMMDDRMFYNMPSNFSTNQDEDLESLYPDIYRLVQPMVESSCSQNTRQITKEVLDEMTNDIYFAIEADDESMSRNVETQSSANPNVKCVNGSQECSLSNRQSQEENRQENRQRFIRNRSLNDLIRILILRELLRRRHFPFPGRPPRPPMRPPMRPPFPGQGRPPFNRGYDFMYEDLYEY